MASAIDSTFRSAVYRGSFIYFDNNDGKLNTVDDPTNEVRSGGIL